MFSCVLCLFVGVEVSFASKPKIILGGCQYRNAVASGRTWSY